MTIRSADDASAPTSIDLFAGAGGLSLGLHEAGWDGILAVEKDPMAFDTLARNLLDDGAPYAAFKKWPDWLPKEPTDLDELLRCEEAVANLHGLRGTVDLVSGGPPCQGFSVGGVRNGLDIRNQLAFRMVDFVDIVRPQAVIVENVEGFARAFQSKPGSHATSVADQVMERLTDLGYGTTLAIVDASEFGVPQIRRRVIVLGLLDVASGDSLDNAFEGALETAGKRQLGELGLPTDRPVTVADALDDLAGTESIVCPDSPKFSSGTYGPVESEYGKLMRKDVPGDAVPQSHRYSRHGERVRNLYELAHATQPPGRLSRDFLRENNTRKDKKVLLDAKRPSSTITTHPDEFIHFTHPRNITVREMARLQSFPDVFHFHGRYTINGPRRKFDVARCSQVGNAVPPLLGRAVGRAVRSLLEESS